MRIVTFLSVILVAACVGCQTSRALKGPIPASPAIGLEDERTERIGKVIRETMHQEKIPGLSIAVVEHGQIVWAQGFGWRDVQRRLPVDVDTQFQAGSISKPLTALGILVLNASGEVDLDTNVNVYLRGWQLNNPFTNQPVTLRELLCHRAGMVPHGFIGYDEYERVPSLLEILNQQNFSLLNSPIKVVQPPGSVYRYSGGGYCVVQKVVEDVTHKPFEDAMSELVLKPIGMSRSNFQQPPLDTNNIACGYGSWMALLGGGRWFVYPQKAAAGLWTTPQDLARFIISVQEAQAGRTTGPVSPAVAHEYLKPHFDPWQGAGVQLDGSGDHRGFFHAGENVGYVACFGATVSMDRGWVIMTNESKGKFAPILNSIVQEFGWKEKNDGAPPAGSP